MPCAASSLIMRLLCLRRSSSHTAVIVETNNQKWKARGTARAAAVGSSAIGSRLPAA